ncbi:MAG: hypothetical protein IT454_20265 [Planctomycetes bacterium]|nr:hypothetical protein [Planctomycetota bacterium]
MEKPSTLQCPACASNYTKESIDATRGVFVCGHCGALATLPGTPLQAPRARPKAPMPSSVKLERDERGAQLTWRWFQPLHVLLACFCIAWDGFLVVWYSIVFGGEVVNWIMMLFPIGHLAVGVALTYATLAGFVNSTRITLDRRELSVRHGPLPWAGNRTLPAADIAQLYCKSKVRRGKRGSTSTTYELWLATKSNRSFKLVGGAESDEQVIFLEQWLETALGLENREMPGELAP